MKITLCGSTKFKEEFEQANRELTMLGHIVLSVGLFGHADNIKLQPSEKRMLDKIHKQKIDISDAIYVINKDHYIGESTRSEVDYALKAGKRVIYMNVPNPKEAFKEV